MLEITIKHLLINDVHIATEIYLQKTVSGKTYMGID